MSVLGAFSYWGKKMCMFDMHVDEMSLRLANTTLNLDVWIAYKLQSCYWFCSNLETLISMRFIKFQILIVIQWCWRWWWWWWWMMMLLAAEAIVCFVIPLAQCKRFELFEIYLKLAFIVHRVCSKSALLQSFSSGFSSGWNNNYPI